MNFLEYSQKTQSNIIQKEGFEFLIQETFQIISENLSRSLGPLGSSTTILEGMMTSATKDGFSILKSMKFRNRYKNMIYNLIMRPCTRLNNTVGDGTTTAVVLTNLLFEEYHGKSGKIKDEDGKLVDVIYGGLKYDLDKYHRLPRQFVKIWDETIKQLTEKIKTYATPLDPEDSDTIYKLSYVVSNGNEEISNNIANAYKHAKSPNIKVKDSPTSKSYTKGIKGFEIPANLIDQAYVRNEDLSVEEKNIAVLIFDFKIEGDLFNTFIHPLNEIFKSKGQKLLIIAPYYDALLANTTLHQYMNQEYQRYKKLNLILSQYAIKDLANKHQVGDLATVLRCKVITQDYYNNLIHAFQMSTDKFDFVTDLFKDTESEYSGTVGVAESALLSCTNGSIFKVKDIEKDDRYNDMLRAAELELEQIKGKYDEERNSYAHEVAKVQERVTQLKMENYIYYVGAESTLQKNIYYDAVVDVIKCIRSAIKTGIVPGCQLSIIRACQEVAQDLEALDHADGNIYNMQRIVLQMVQNAVISLYEKILHGPEGRGMIKLIDLWEHISKDDEDAVKDLLTKAREKAAEILTESIKRNEVFDLENLVFSKDIITSAETDVNILKASSELVKLLISGNQCVFLDAEINDDEQDITVFHDDL